MTRISLVWRFSKNGNSTPTEQSTPFNARLITLSRTHRTLFHVTENVEDLFFLDDRYQLFDLIDKYVRRHYAHTGNESFHSKMFHVSPDELSQIYFEYLAWYKLLWLFLNLVPYIAMRVMLATKESAEAGA